MFKKKININWTFIVVNIYNEEMLAAGQTLEERRKTSIAMADWAE